MTCLSGQTPKYKCGTTLPLDCYPDNCDGTGYFATRAECIASGCGGGTIGGGIPKDYIILAGAVVGLLIIKFMGKKKGK